MKNYKLLVPLVLVVLFAASIFMTFDSNGKTEKLYKDYLAAARSFAEQGIIVDAIENYQNAIGVKDSFALNMEIANFYKSQNEIDMAVSWGHEILKDYPKSIEAYKFLMEMYIEIEDYTACFKLNTAMQKRKLPMNSVSEIMEKINYNYFLHGQYEAVATYGGGFCAIMTKGAWGFVNETGSKVISTQYLEVGSYRQDLVPVLDNESQAYFIDIEGNKKKVIVGVEKVARLGSIEEGCFTLFDGDTWGLYDNDCKLISGGFDEVSSFTNGVVAVKKDARWSLIDSTGAVLLQNIYDEIVQDEKGIVYRNERLFVKENGFYYLVDILGKRISENKFEEAKLFNDNSYAAVKADGKWGFIDANGEYFIKPEYADARSFSSEFAAVHIDGKWGFINTEKKLVIENTFEDVKDFNGRGCVFVTFGDGWELLRLYKYNH